MTRARTLAALVAGLLLPAVAGAQGANAKVAPGSPTADRLPIYEVDPAWPPTLPNDWILGDIRGLFVDDRDHLWVIHMPSSLTPQEIDTILGGEFEEGLVSLCQRLNREKTGIGSDNGFSAGQNEPLISLNRQQYITPERQDLPPLTRYAQLCCENCAPKITGYVESSRGCKHHCRHCPVVPVYGGQFRLVQCEIVIEDIEQQVNSGAGHITFGHPDFFNGPGHVIPIVEKMHQLWPHLTYDVTIKIEHLLKYQRWLPLLRDTGCAFVTSAVESIDDRVLEIFATRRRR